MMRVLLIAICLCLSFLFSPHAFSAEYVIWGPQTYTSEAGKPSSTTTTFKSRITGEGAAKLVILNGGSSGKHPVSSGRIVLNGKEVAGPSDFNQKADFIEKTISLEYSNTLAVKLASGPGSFLTIKVVGKYPAPVVHITSPAPSDTIFTPGALVRGWVETAAQYVEVTINDQTALVNGNEFFTNALPLIEGSNTIRVRMEDSYHYAAESQITVFSEQQAGTVEWIDLKIDEPGGFAPLDTRLTARPHLHHDLVTDSANLQCEGPGGMTITPESATEYRLHFDSPGFYTFKYSVADTSGKIHVRQAVVTVLEFFTESEWQTMNDSVQALKDYFSFAIVSQDIKSARQETFQRALGNPDFSQVEISGSALCLIYQGKIPFIIDLPDPNGPEID